MVQPDTNTEKVVTKFPGLHKAMGTDPGVIEVASAAPADPAPVDNPPADPTPAAEATPAEVPAAEAAPATKGKIDFSTLTDEEKVEMLAALTGGKVKSLKDLEEAPAKKTAAEIEAEAKAMKEAALAWGLDNKIISQEEYDAAIVGKSKSDRDVALAVFAEEMLAEDKDATPAEIEEAFKDYYGEHLEPTDKIFKLGQRRMQKIAAEYRKEKFGNVDALDSKYTSHLELQSQYKGYKNTLKSIVAELPKTMDVAVPFVDVDGAQTELKFSLNVDEGVVKKLVNELTDEKAFQLRSQYSGGKVNDKVLQQEVQFHLKGLLFDQALPAIMEHVAKEVETRTIAIMGNKRNSLQPLNNGQQSTATTTEKKNEYPALRNAMAAKR